MRVKSLFICLFILITLACAEQAIAELSAYTITDLGTLGLDVQSKAYGINDSGQVVGYSGTEFGEEGRRAFLWDNGTMTNIGTLGGNHSEAYDINNYGQIVGRATTADIEYQMRGFMWEDGLITELPITGGHWGEAHSINNSGQIAGYSSNSSGHLFASLWENGSITLLNPNGGNDATIINDLGQIVSYSYNDSSAVLWENGSITILGTFGGDYSFPTDLNNQGQVIGRFETGYGNYDHGFLWDSESFTDLGVGRPLAINDIGQIIGSNWLWEDGVRNNLSDLLPYSIMWDSLYAEDINNVGQIVGSGRIDGEVHAFLMTPIPEPATLCLFALGAVLLKRKR